MTSIFGSGAGLAFGDELQRDAMLNAKSSLKRTRSVLLPERWNGVWRHRNYARVPWTPSESDSGGGNEGVLAASSGSH
jgi:hypothetical protein